MFEIICCCHGLCVKVLAFLHHGYMCTFVIVLVLLDEIISTKGMNNFPTN